MFPVLVNTERHLALLGEFDGIAQQIGQYLADPVRVSTEVFLRQRVVELQLQALAAGFQAEHVDLLLAQLA